MRYIIILCMLITACTSTRKSISRLQQQATENFYKQRDSSGHMTVDVVNVKRDSIGVTATTDSVYDRITEEVIAEKKTDSGEFRVITRTIKEKGHKRTETVAETKRSDSTMVSASHHVQENELEQSDSTVTIDQVLRNVKRDSFLPWWIWLIAAGVVGVAWWFRNPIIDFFT